MATVTVFLGSIREGRQSEHVAHYVATSLAKRGHTVHFIDPLEHPDILTLHAPYHFTQEHTPDMEQLHQWLLASNGFVLVTPEYNHSFSGTLKNAIDNFFPEYAGKPFGIVACSDGMFGGVRAAEALRIVISTLKGVSIPTALTTASVQNVFDEQGNLKDPKYAERTEKFIVELESYIKKMQG